MKNELRLGYRDAVHVPYIVVSSEYNMVPGQKITLRHGNKCDPWRHGDPIMWHGVSDPFAEETINRDTPFMAYIRKECFRGLRHDFMIEVHDTGGADTCHSVYDIV